jgi:hypothetical protein
MTTYEVTVEDAATDAHHAMLCTTDLGRVEEFVNEWCTLEPTDLRITIEVVRE